MHQYRVIVNDSTGPITDAQPDADRWGEIARIAEERGGVAELQQRFVGDADIIEMLGDARGWMRLGSRVVSPWMTLARVEG